MNGLVAVDGLIWFLVSITALVSFQKILHREIQSFLLIVTRRPGITQVIFAIIFFPGVFLHESSHFLMAKLLGVKTGKFSIFPHAMPNGRLRLGFVETETGGYFRDALIGIAPLITGCVFIAIIGAEVMELLPVWYALLEGDSSSFWFTLEALLEKPDFFLWVYFTFVVSSTMLPSASDRHAWLPVGVFFILLVVLALLAGAGEWMVEHLTPIVDTFFNVLAMIFGLSVLIHVLLVVPFFILHKFAAKLSGVDAR